MARYVTKSCPYCGNKYQILAPVSRYYGSPLRTCSKCKKQYIDKDFIEVAADKLNAYKPSIVSAWSVLTFVIFTFFSFVGITLGHSIGFLLVVFAFGSVPMILDAWQYDERIKQYKKEYEESKKRLEDPHYVLFLARLESQDIPIEMIRAAHAKIESEKKNSQQMC